MDLRLAQIRVSHDAREDQRQKNTSVCARTAHNGFVPWAHLSRLSRLLLAESQEPRQSRKLLTHYTRLVISAEEGTQTPPDRKISPQQGPTPKSSGPPGRKRHQSWADS